VSTTFRGNRCRNRRSRGFRTKVAAKKCGRINSQKIPPQTWKAICTRDGVYNTVAKKQHNWQEDFAGPIKLPLAVAWAEIVNKRMAELFKQHEINILHEFRTFGDSLDAIVPLCNGTTSKLLQGIPERRLLLENQAKIELSSIRRLGGSCAQAVAKETTKVVKSSLQPYTSRMCMETGKGVGRRMRDLLSDHISKISKQMYVNMAAEIRKILKYEQQKHFEKLSEASLRPSKALSKEVRKMFESPSSGLSATAQSTLFRTLSMEGQKLEKSWKDAIKQQTWQNELEGPSLKDEDIDDSEGEDDEDISDGESDGEEEDQMDTDMKNLGKLIRGVCN